MIMMMMMMMMINKVNTMTTRQNDLVVKKYLLSKRPSNRILSSIAC